MKNTKEILKTLLKLIYSIIIISTPVFLLYYWNFQYVDKIIEFLKISWWPIVVLIIIFIFKDELGSFINEISELSIFGNKAKREKQIPNQENQPSKDIELSKEYKEINEQYKNIINSLGNDVGTLKDQLTRKEIELDFERIYNVLFGSQLFILKYLTTTNFTGLNDIAKYYETIQKNNPTLQSWGIDKYLSFLISSQLIEPAASGGFQITLKGKVFITYIESRNYTINKML